MIRPDLLWNISNVHRVSSCQRLYASHRRLTDLLWQILCIDLFLRNKNNYVLYIDLFVLEVGSEIFFFQNIYYLCSEKNGTLEYVKYAHQF